MLQSLGKEKMARHGVPSITGSCVVVLSSSVVVVVDCVVVSTLGGVVGVVSGGAMGADSRGRVDGAGGSSAEHCLTQIR